jgi:hypothetical protein
MDITLTPIGWLTLLSLAAVSMLGSQITPIGISAYLEFGPQKNTLGITPIVLAQSSNYQFQGAVTLGGTIVMVSPQSALDCIPRCQQVAKWLEGWQRDLLAYELGHVDGWKHFGIQYGLKVLEADTRCLYDPQGFAFLFGKCSSPYRPFGILERLEPRQGAIEFRWNN